MAGHPSDDRPRPSRRVQAVSATLLAGAVAFLPACNRSATPVGDRSVPTVTEVSLLDRSFTAGGAGTDVEAVRKVQLEITRDRRPALVQHPPSTVHFADIPNREGAVLAVAPALPPEARDRGSDGVAFIVRCTGDTGAYIDLTAVSVAESGPWRDLEIPLDSCSQPMTTIVFETGCGAVGDCRWDTAVWGTPAIRLPTLSTVKPARLTMVISIDTLRPDRLGLYGGTRPTSPNIDRFAADSVIFDTAVAPSPWTLPSHVSMMTSTYPLFHGADQAHAVPSSLATLAEAFHASGWQTAGFADVVWLSHKYGFERGFEHYECRSAEDLPVRGGRWSSQRLTEWLDRAGNEPAFVFWHLFDVHAPYGARAPHGGRFRGGELAPRRHRPLALLRSPAHRHLLLDRYVSVDDVIASYDEGIAATDHVVGKILDLLRATGRYDEALIIVTSDHGESLFDHEIWIGHGLFLTDDEVRVPLIVKLPGNAGAGRRISDQVSLLDIAPTVLEITGIARPPTFRGRSLRPLSLGRAEARATAPVFGFAEDTGAVSVRDSRFKLITAWGFLEPFSTPSELFTFLAASPGDTGVRNRLRSAAGEAFYDLREDPAETTNLIASAPVSLVTAYRDLARRHAVESRELNRLLYPAAAREAKLTAEEIRLLQSLGYPQRVSRPPAR